MINDIKESLMNQKREIKKEVPIPHAKGSVKERIGMFEEIVKKNSDNK